MWKNERMTAPASGPKLAEVWHVLIYELEQVFKVHALSAFDYLTLARP